MFQSEGKTWNIHNLIDKTGHMKKEILVIHALLRCDTASRIYGIGKYKITKSPKMSIFVVKLLQYFITIHPPNWMYKKQGESSYLTYITELT